MKLHQVQFILLEPFRGPQISCYNRSTFGFISFIHLNGSIFPHPPPRCRWFTIILTFWFISVDNCNLSMNLVLRRWLISTAGKRINIIINELLKDCSMNTEVRINNGVGVYTVVTSNQRHIVPARLSAEAEFIFCWTSTSIIIMIFHLFCSVEP